ncbi:MAG: PepSY-associated TM helix domain-containing protein [Pseudomonadota bacterium]
MQRDRRVRIYDAHSWTGISLGLVLFVVCFTGSLAMFYHEIHSWQDPAARLPAEVAAPVPVDPLFRDWKAELGDVETTFMALNYPSAMEPYYHGQINARGEDGEISFEQRRWNPQTGEVLPERGEGLATWLRDFHRDLMWPAALGGRQIGRGLVGIFGIVMMLSIVTGIITHRKILKEMFTLRRTRSVRVKWKDAHNVLGVWSLPFSVVMAFTGAWLGIVALLLPVTGLLVVEGDAEKLLEVLGGDQIVATGKPAEMLSLDLVAQRPHSGSDNPPVAVYMTHWGDEAAIYELQYLPDTELLYYEPERISGVTGAVLPLTGFLERTPGLRVLGSMAPLHYGLYGGLALKLLYFALGIALSVMVALGNMVWIERRLHSAEGSRSPRFYDRLSKLTVGVCLGVVLASIAIFFVDRLYTGPEESRITTIGWSYFLVWAAGLIFAFARRNNYQTTRLLLAASGFALMTLPVFNALTSNMMPWTSLQAGHAASPAVDLALLIFGIGAVLVAQRMPSSRREREKRRAQPEAGGAAAPLVSP